MSLRAGKSARPGGDLQGVLCETARADATRIEGRGTLSGRLHRGVQIPAYMVIERINGEGRGLNGLLFLVPGLMDLDASAPKIFNDEEQSC